jgi:hypothetical protein
LSTEYILDIRTKNNDSKRISVTNTPITLGSDNSAEICFKEEQLSPLHLKFRLQDDILTINQLGQDDSTKLGRQKLKQGKMYIIDKGDKLTLGSIKVIIRKEKIKEEPISEEKTKEIKTSKNSKNNDDEVDETNKMDKDELSSIVRKAAHSRNNTTAITQMTQMIQKKSVSFERHLLPGTFSRLTSHFITLLFSICLLTYIADILDITEIIDKNYKALIPHAETLTKQVQIKAVELSTLYEGKIPYKVPTIEEFDFRKVLNYEFQIKVLLSFLLLNFGSIFLFGVEFPLFLMGVRAEGNFVFNRIKGIFRYILGLLTFPFLIFDLPILFKRRSLKEVLTFSKLQYKKSGMQYSALLLKAPLMVIVLLFAPIGLFVDKLVPSTTVDKVVTKPQKKKKEITYNPLTRLELQIPVKEKKDYLILPSIYSAKDTFKATMLIAENTTQTTAKLKVEKRFYYDKYLPDLKRLDPLFSLHSNVVATSTDISLVAYQQEATDLIEDILSFNIYGLHKFLLKRGPFIYPYLKARKKIQERSNLPLGLAFHSFSSNQKTILNSKNKKVILFIDDGFIQLEITSAGKNKKLPRAIFKYFLLESKKLENVELVKHGELSGVEFYDLIYKIGNNKNDNHSFETEQIILYLLEVSLESLTKEQAFNQKEIKKFLTDLDKFYLNLDKNRQKQYKEVRLVANRIQKAIDKKDTKFLETNIKTTKRNLNRKIKKYNRNQNNKKKVTKKKNTKKESKNATRKRKRTKNKSKNK